MKKEVLQVRKDQDDIINIALRLTKHLAQNMLRKIRKAMADRDRKHLPA